MDLIGEIQAENYEAEIWERIQVFKSNQVECEDVNKKSHMSILRLGIMTMALKRRGQHI